MYVYMSPFACCHDGYACLNVGVQYIGCIGLRPRIDDEHRHRLVRATPVLLRTTSAPACRPVLRAFV